jgi:hypothetical protein
MIQLTPPGQTRLAYLEMVGIPVTYIEALAEVRLAGELIAVCFAIEPFRTTATLCLNTTQFDDLHHEGFHNQWYLVELAQILGDFPELANGIQISRRII